MERNTKAAILFYLLDTLSAIIYLTWRALYTIPYADGLFAVSYGILLLASDFAAISSRRLLHPLSIHGATMIL